MARIFSKIARNIEPIATSALGTGIVPAKSLNLIERYTQSTVTNTLNTFTALRVQGGTNTLFISNLPQNVYDLYTDPATIAAPLSQIFTTSELVRPENIVRIRSSRFYEGFRNTNSNLTVSNLPVNNTFVEIKPYTRFNLNQTYSVDTSRMLQNSRSTPLISGPRDIVRMGRYLNSREGVTFKAFQQILQAGNTFGQSQAYNPISVETQVLNYSNATLFNPLQRVSRILTGNAITNPELQGRLQKKTVLDIQSRLRLKFVGGAARPQQSPVLRALNNLLGATLENKINNINIPLPGFARNLFGNSINVGQTRRQLDAIAAGADALRRGINTNNSTLETDQTAYDSLYRNNLWPLVKENDGTITNFDGVRGTKTEYINRARQAIRKGKDINDVNKNTIAFATIPNAQGSPDEYRSSATYTEDVQSTGTKTTKDGLTTAVYIKDTFNYISNGNGPIVDIKELEAGDSIDYINFKIVVPGVFDSGVKFRAFIEDITHNSKGQYDEVRYVGRPERFMTYRGMNRSIQFSLYLIAFGEDELNAVWARANMLNKLTFPIDTSGGFMTPPLAKITIGNLIVDQPGYVDNVDMRLQTEAGITWDIDKELPQAVKLNMSFNIIEKSFLEQTNTLLRNEHILFGSTQAFNTENLARDRGYDINEFLNGQRRTNNNTPFAVIAQNQQYTPKATNLVPQTPVNIQQFAQRQTIIRSQTEL
jgi:hypothetical protein